MSNNKNKSKEQSDSAKSSDLSSNADKSNTSEETIEIASPGESLRPQHIEEPPLQQQSPLGSASEPADTQAPDMKEPVSNAPTSKSKGSESADPVKRLSSEQVQNINSRFSSDHEVASENEREQLLKSLSSESDKRKNTSEQPDPIIAESKSTVGAPPPQKPVAVQKAPPKKAAEQINVPVRGIAHFSGRIITLGATEKMTTESELTVNGNRYQLKPGKASSNVLGYVVSAVLIIASAFVGKFYLAEGQVSGGEILGVALSQNGAPYQSGAVVRLPELGISTVTNAEGLFHFTNVPNGTYKLEYNLAGSLGGSQTVSVHDNGSSMITLDGATKRLAQTIVHSPERPSSPRSATKSQSKTTAKATSRKANGRGALAVTSDVSGAIVFIDNQKLGKINNTFRRMNTGSRTIRIEKAGYETYVGSVNIKSGKIAKVNVTLEPLASQTEPAVAPMLSANDLFQTGREAFRNDENEVALEFLNKALDKDPSLADAYYFRAEALAKSGDSHNAELDYIRAGETWSRQKRTQDARSAFDNAIAISNGSALSYKVRGDFFVGRKNREKGINDYNNALKADKNYYDAHLALGIANFESGSYRHADKALRRAKDFNDKDPVLYHYLMLNSLAKNNLSDVNRYYKQFKKKASSAEMARFKSDNRLVAIRRIVKD